MNVDIGAVEVDKEDYGYAIPLGKTNLARRREDCSTQSPTVASAAPRRARKPTVKLRLRAEDTDTDQPPPPKKKSSKPAKSKPLRAFTRTVLQVEQRRQSRMSERADVLRMQPWSRRRTPLRRENRRLTNKHGGLEHLLEKIPEGEKNRWQKISKAMGGRRTPRQVASRVQKYFEKLKKYGVVV